MKKNLLKSLLLFLLLPVMAFSGCKKSSLPAINLSTYLKNDITVKYFNISSTQDNTIELLSKKKPDTKDLSKYLKFTINANSVWFYKMYIESISFYIYCNEDCSDEMTLNLTISDTATEDTILNSVTESVVTETFESQLALTPKAKKSIKCNFPVNRTIVNALGSTITIDILNSLNLFSGDEENPSTFAWLIYGLEIHGESRTYSR